MPQLFFVKGSVSAGYAAVPAVYESGAFAFKNLAGYTFGGKLKIGSPFQRYSFTGSLFYTRVEGTSSYFGVVPAVEGYVAPATGNTVAVFSTNAGFDYAVLYLSPVLFSLSGEIGLNAISTGGNSAIARYGAVLGAGAEVSLSPAVAASLEASYRVTNLFVRESGEGLLGIVQLSLHLFFTFFTLP
ncbi:MAG: hypothetical protein IAF08_00090 [Rhizobacter sp.]|nr:hypothetical protein [Chlorobiales bacterium]